MEDWQEGGWFEGGNVALEGKSVFWLQGWQVGQPRKAYFTFATMAKTAVSPAMHCRALLMYQLLVEGLYVC